MIQNGISLFIQLFQFLRVEMKKSRFKIWLRAALFIQFCGIFGFFFFRYISNGHFNWGRAFLTAGLFVPIGFLMSRIVLMETNLDDKAVTLSNDRVYLVLIWILVIVKVVTGQIPSLLVVADIIMCAILGVMSGRLGGIGIRVRNLKIQNGLLTK